MGRPFREAGGVFAFGTKGFMALVKNEYTLLPADVFLSPAYVGLVRLGLVNLAPGEVEGLLARMSVGLSRRSDARQHRREEFLPAFRIHQRLPVVVHCQQAVAVAGRGEAIRLDY